MNRIAARRRAALAARSRLTTLVRCGTLRQHLNMEQSCMVAPSLARTKLGCDKPETIRAALIQPPWGEDQHMSAPSTERVQRLHTKRRLLGLCLRCAQPLSGTTAYCLGCRAKENAAHRARRLAYRTLSRDSDSCGRCRRPRVGLTALCETHYFQ